MLDGIEIDEMERLGKELGPKLVKKTFTFLNLELDLDGIIEHYFRPLSKNSKWYNFNIAGSGTGRKLLFEHPYARSGPLS
jgi:hypothetical protein